MKGVQAGSGTTESVSALSMTPPPVPSGIPQWSPEILELHEFLKGIWPAEGLPSRRDFDPTDVPKLLPHIWLIELGTDIHEHRYRLAGSSVAASVGMDYSSKRLVDVHPNLLGKPDSYAFIEEVRGSGLPHWYNGEPRASHAEDVVRIQNLIAPLTGSGGAIDFLLGIAIVQLADDVDYDFSVPKRRSYLTPNA